MSYFRPVLILILILGSFISRAQTVQLIGTSDDFILENVKGYDSVEERSLEHEEFNILVFEGKDKELSFYFTFFRGEKVCSYIKNTGKPSALNEEILFVKSHFKNTKDNIWESSGKSIQAEITEKNGFALLLVKALR
ncbi:hypothetical protein [Daejeonella sp.]|uniref:hypothetical protein n=1 Tax=Daejeonella sp. TaxID=2805397 RepID=UPI0030C0BBA6